MSELLYADVGAQLPSGPENNSGTGAEQRYRLLVAFMVLSSYWLEYGANFLFVARVSPVTFSVVDIVRRLLSILANAMIFGYPFASLNASGICKDISHPLY